MEHAHRRRHRADHPAPAPGHAEVNSGGTLSARTDDETLVISIELGELNDVFPSDRSDPAWKHQRLFALGYLCQAPDDPAPTTGNATQKIGELAWEYFKRVNGNLSESAAMDALEQHVRERIVLVDPPPDSSSSSSSSPDGSAQPAPHDAMDVEIPAAKRLPAPGAYGRVRVPGAYLVTDAACTPAMYGPYNPAGLGMRSAHEAQLLALNNGVGYVPLVVKLAARRVRDGRLRALPGKLVSLSLVEPEAAASGLYATVEDKVRNTTFTVVPIHADRGGPWSPRRYLRDWIGYYYPPRADDVQRGNRPSELGGKRGRPVAGSSRADNVLFVPEPHDAEAAPEGTPARVNPPAFARALETRRTDENTVSAVTDSSGKAAFVFMPSTIAGDRYRLRVTYAPPATTGHDPPPAVASETGTLIVWRTVRVETWYRWNYPTTPTPVQQANCGGELTSLDIDQLPRKFSDYFLDVQSAGSLADPTTIETGTRTAALAHARYMVPLLLPTFPAGYDAGLYLARGADALRADLLRMFPDGPVGPGFVNIDKEQCRAVLKAVFNWTTEIASQDDPLKSRMQQVLDAMLGGVYDYFSRQHPGAPAILQAPSYNSIGAELPNNDAFVRLFVQSGMSGLRRGCFVVSGRDGYLDAQGRRLRAHSPADNAIHELGHLFYLRHPGGAARDHDRRDVCTMSYTRTQPYEATPTDDTYKIDYCGRCVLHLTGCKTSGIPHNGLGGGLRVTVFGGTVQPAEPGDNGVAHRVLLFSHALTMVCFASPETAFPNLTPLNLNNRIGQEVVIRGFREDEESEVFECVVLDELRGDFLDATGVMSNAVREPSNQPIGAPVRCTRDVVSYDGTINQGNPQLVGHGRRVVGVLSGTTLRSARERPTVNRSIANLT